MLKEFANRIAKNIRGVDLAARYGGEEFVVMMPETTQDWATIIGDRLREEVGDQPFEIGNGEEPISITVSIGVATSDEAVTPQVLLEQADKALYQAKEGGRNQVVVAT